MDISLLAPEDAPELQRLIRQAAQAKQRDRLRAVELAIAGYSTPEIMQMLGRSRGFVHLRSSQPHDRPVLCVDRADGQH